MTSTLQVRVKGRYIDTYQHQDRFYVEGRKGSEYTIHFRNNSSQRKKIVVSVDGLNVVTGDSNWDRGYMVPAWGTIDIPGWRKSDKVTASFQFSSIKSGYNQHNDSGDKKNIGVIGCLVFDEKVKPIPAVYHHYYTPYPYYWNGPLGLTCQNINTTSLQGSYYGPIGANFTNTSGGVASVLRTANATEGGPIGANMSPQIPVNLNQSDMTYTASGHRLDIKPDVYIPKKVEQQVSTGWGRDKEFKTTTVEFDDQETASETLLIYYDSRENLSRMGVIKLPSVPKIPEAFPGYRDGCPEPKYVMKNR